MKNNKNGFTLVEIIVAMFIGLLALAAIYSVVNSAQKSSTGIERKVIAQQDARSALELMAMEIRMASYNPNLVQNIWRAQNDCSSQAGDLNYRGIQEATANSLTIEMDINDNGIIDDTNSNPNETIKYVYNAANQYITRSTNCGGNQPFLGDTNANEAQKTVLVVNDSVGIPVFRYYNGSGTEITSPVTASIPDIRRIEITLVLDTAYSDPSTGGRKRIIYSTSVIPHNHRTTLSY
jgi:prepilin-type N-terminal cleavage/methylation domain-containing protein